MQPWSSIWAGGKRRARAVIGEAPLPVVYTMGKVASSSYSAAIHAQGLPCLDIHTLDKKLLLRHMRESLSAKEFPPPHVCQAMQYYEVARNPAACSYITGVREPVERNLSAYFQNLDSFAPDLSDFDRADAAATFSDFMTTYSHHVPLVWFERELKGQLGIDVFEFAFDTGRRAVFFEEPRLAILRTDAEPETKNRVLSKAASASIRVGTANVGTEKVSGSLYRATVEAAVFTADFLDDVYSSRYAEHFWTEEERKVLKAKWLGEADPSGAGSIGREGLTAPADSSKGSP